MKNTKFQIDKFESMVQVKKLTNMNQQIVSPAIRTQIASILNIVDDMSSWTIIDKDEDASLYNIHYTDDADRTVFGSLRGVVVDLKLSKIVCRSYGYTPSVIHNSVDASFGRLRLGYEGTIIRVFQHNEKTYASTHKRLNPIRSRWGNSPTFAEIYKNLNGPVSELFNSPDDNTVYVFLIIHKSLCVASHRHVPEEGRLLYLDAFNPATNERVNPSEHAEKVLSSIEHSVDVDIDTANKALSENEFLINFKNDGSVVRINSSVYEQRNVIRNGDSNLYHNYVELLNVAKRTTPEDVAIFEALQKLPLNESDEKEILNKVRENNVYVDPDLVVNGSIDVFVRWWCNLPPHQCAEAEGYYNKYHKELMDLVNFIYRCCLDTTLHISKELKVIVENVYKRARHPVNDPRSKSHVIGIIKRILAPRHCGYLYKLVQEMRQAEKREVYLANKKQ